MSRKLTKKQRDFVDAYIETGNGTKSALIAYDTEDYSTADSIATENLQKPAIVAALEEALPDDLLHQIHREGLYATKGIYDDEGERIAEDADFNARHKYLDTAYKLKGSYAPEKRVTLTLDGELEPIERGLATRLLERQKSA